MIDMLTDPAALGELFATMLRLSVPLVFAALGGVFSERAGVVNISLEGSMILGAFGAAWGAIAGGSAGWGVVTGALAGGMLGAAFGIATIYAGANQIVAGIGANLAGLGLAAFLHRLTAAGRAAENRVPGFGDVTIPGLADIPMIGKALFSTDPMTWAAILAVPLSALILARTGIGLRLKAVGENPRAADVAGLPVRLYRLGAVIVCGMLAGLGGAVLVLSQVFLFTEGMTAGKGFIAVAAVILGRWSPVGAALACLLFGLSDAIQLRLQFANGDVPYQLFVMLPYLAAILTLVGLVGRSRPPQASGSFYRRESR